MTHMTNTRIKDTLYEDAHLDERGKKQAQSAAGGRWEWRCGRQCGSHCCALGIFLYFSFLSVVVVPEADDNCSAYPLPV